MTWRGVRTNGRAIVMRCVVLAALVLLLDVAVLALAPKDYRIDVGTYRAGYFVSNTGDPQTAGDNTTYRWTLGDSMLRFEPLGSGTRTLVTYEFGGRPEPGAARLLVDGVELAGFTAQTTPQRVAVLLPEHAFAAHQLTLQSDVFSTPSDSRSLGVRLDWITLSRLPGAVPWPPLVPYGAQLAVLAAVWAIVGRLGASMRLRDGMVAMLALGFALALWAVLPMAGTYFTRLALMAAFLAWLTFAVLRHVERMRFFANAQSEARLLWAVMLLACVLRGAGALFPTFAGQDLHYHRDWTAEVLSGDLLLAVHSFEFEGGIIIYPPGTYVALLPGLLLTPNVQPILQGPLAVLDGSATLLVAFLAYQLGLGRLAARFAAVLYAASLPTFTAIAYGFSAQVLAQWFIPLLALALLYAAEKQRVRWWAGAMFIFLLPLLLHIGVAILAVIWIGLVVVLLVVNRPAPATRWLLPLYVAAGGIAFLFVYSNGIATMLAHAGDIVGGEPGTAPSAPTAGMFKGATPLLWKGARLAYSEIGLALLPIGAALLPWRALRYPQRVIAGTWLVTCAVFFVVDLVLALQVRYFYFSIPLAVVLIGYALSRIAALHRWGRALAWVAVLVIVLQGALPWLGAAFGDVHLSLTPLTH